MKKQLLSFFISIIILIVSLKYFSLEKIGQFEFFILLFVCISILFEAKRFLLQFEKLKFVFNNNIITYNVLYISSLFLIVLYMPTVCSYGNIRYVRLLFLLVIIYKIIQILKVVYKKPLNERFKNILLSFSTTIIFLLIIEIVCMFISYPFGGGNTYAGSLFNYKYWNPINKDGFRDEEFKKNENEIIFLGDSFTAGWGIKKIENRFSEIATQNIHNKIKSVNLGQFGADSKIEFENLKKHFHKYCPKTKIVVLQLFYNDIDPYLDKIKPSCNKLEEKNKLNDLFINGSYFLNFTSNFIPNNNQVEIDEDCKYETKLEKGFKNPKIFNKMAAYHDSIIQFCNKRNIELKVVFFPFMEDLKFAKKIGIEQKFETFFKSRNIRFINITNYITHLSKEERQASKMDAHASEKVHLITGKVIAKEIDKIWK